MKGPKTANEQVVGKGDAQAMPGKMGNDAKTPMLRSANPRMGMTNAKKGNNSGLKQQS
jgi:hypothetical protein